MIYAVIDTNVLVSALLNIHSKPGEVLLSVFNGQTIPLLNQEIVAEYKEVLSRKKFMFPEQMVDVVLNGLVTNGMQIDALSESCIAVNDPKDQCFYAVTMSGRQTEDALLVTGNIRHFPSEAFVVTPAQFVEILQQRIKAGGSLGAEGNWSSH